ncbi:hypothetical protein K1719_023166 [Acacia pycnantha]|nr:hypothetical protein K1719_023166 [Acacia pycnantha]
MTTVQILLTPSDARISSFRLKVPSPKLERSLKIKEILETSLILKKILLVSVLAGTSMVIANGVVTPAMSGAHLNISGLWELKQVGNWGKTEEGLGYGDARLSSIILGLLAVAALLFVNWKPLLLSFICDSLSLLSSVGGLKVGVDAIEHDEVVVISVACLIVLFSVQKYGTSKVGLAVGPALFIWFCSLAGIGMYSLLKYDTTVLRAFNPIHIYDFFKRNSTKAWWFVLASFLIANIAAPIASHAMTTATFSCIKQSTALGCFPRLKIIHTLRKFMGQNYIPVDHKLVSFGCFASVCLL